MIPVVQASPLKVRASATASLILDNLGGATTGVGLRKLRSAYSGAAIQVYLSTATTTYQDIGFTSGGALDTGSLLSFAGSGTVYINKWYDQSGSGLDLLSLGTTHDMRIVNAGTIDTINSVPAAYIPDTSRGYLSTVFGANYTGTTMSASLVASLTSAVSSARYLGVFGTGADTNTGGMIMVYRPSTNQTWGMNRLGSALASKAAPSYGTLASVMSTMNGTNSQVYVNGSAGSTVSSTGTFGGTRISLCSTNNTPGFNSDTGAYICEAIWKLASGAWGSTEAATLHSYHQSAYGTT